MDDDSQNVDVRITITANLLRYLESLGMTEDEILRFVTGKLTDSESARIADAIESDNNATQH